LLFRGLRCSWHQTKCGRRQEEASVVSPLFPERGPCHYRWEEGDSRDTEERGEDGCDGGGPITLLLALLLQIRPLHYLFCLRTPRNPLSAHFCNTDMFLKPSCPQILLLEN